MIYDDIRQILTHENHPSRGSGQALPTSAGNAGIAVSRVPLVPEHVLRRDCHKNKTESHFSECELYVTV